MSQFIQISNKIAPIQDKNAKKNSLELNNDIYGPPLSHRDVKAKKQIKKNSLPPSVVSSNLNSEAKQIYSNTNSNNVTQFPLNSPDVVVQNKPQTKTNDDQEKDNQSLIMYKQLPQKEIILSELERAASSQPYSHYSESKRQAIFNKTNATYKQENPYLTNSQEKKSNGDFQNQKNTTMFNETKFTDLSEGPDLLKHMSQAQFFPGPTRTKHLEQISRKSKQMSSEHKTGFSEQKIGFNEQVEKMIFSRNIAESMRSSNDREKSSYRSPKKMKNSSQNRSPEQQLSNDFLTVNGSPTRLAAKLLNSDQSKISLDIQFNDEKTKTFQVDQPKQVARSYRFLPSLKMQNYKVTIDSSRKSLQPNQDNNNPYTSNGLNELENYKQMSGIQTRYSFNVQKNVYNQFMTSEQLLPTNIKKDVHLTGNSQQMIKFRNKLVQLRSSKNLKKVKYVQFPNVNRSPLDNSQQSVYKDDQQESIISIIPQVKTEYSTLQDGTFADKVQNNVKFERSVQSINNKKLKNLKPHSSQWSEFSGFKNDSFNKHSDMNPQMYSRIIDDSNQQIFERKLSQTSILSDKQSNGNVRGKSAEGFESTRQFRDQKSDLPQQMLFNLWEQKAYASKQNASKSNAGFSRNKFLTQIKSSDQSLEQDQQFLNQRPQVYKKLTSKPLRGGISQYKHRNSLDQIRRSIQPAALYHDRSQSSMLQKSLPEYDHVTEIINQLAPKGFLPSQGRLPVENPKSRALRPAHVTSYNLRKMQKRSISQLDKGFQSLRVQDNSDGFKQ